MKKGNIALEFLLSYGWAMIVVIVMIVALFYFGDFTPTNTDDEIVEYGEVCNCNHTTFNIELTNKNEDNGFVCEDVCWNMFNTSGVISIDR